jgi:lipopolysaccharide/colanic/teichoic acid biosynthesis glycosyltransferase
MRRLRILLYGGIASIVLGLGKVHAVAHGYDLTTSSRFVWTISYIALLAIAAYGLGFPELRGTRRGAALGALQVAGLAVAGVSAVQILTGDALLPRVVVFGSAVVVMPYLVTCARLAEDHVTGMQGCDRVLLVADEPERTRIADELVSVPERRAELVGALGPDAASTLNGGSPVGDLARARAATVVVLCRDAFADESVVAQVSLLHEAGVRIRTVPAFSEEWLGKVPMSELERTSLLFDVGELHDGRYAPVKRLLDVALALPGLIALAAVVPFVAVGNLIGNNRGPLLFRQERVGKGGSVFRMVKFRTMPPGSDARWTTHDDERLGPFGRFLRRTHIDELPQVVNILRGELSVVGPRPEQPAYVEELTRKLPFYDVRHLVRPGLTGWAQVKYGYAGDERDALEKLQYEFFYLRHQNVRLDLRIIGRTLRTILGRSGR